MPHIVVGIHESDRVLRERSNEEDAIVRVTKEGLRDKVTSQQKPKESEGMIVICEKRKYMPTS